MATVDGDGTEGGGNFQPPQEFWEETEPNVRLSLLPNMEHVSDNYDDLRLEYSSSVLNSLEKHLPMEMLSADRLDKYSPMADILGKYISRVELTMAKNCMEYRQIISSNYQPRFQELYDLDPKFLLLHSFRNAISENTEESFRRVISEPFPGLFVFQMFQPDFFQRLLVEVENFRKWAYTTDVEIKRPTTQSTPGVVLDDFGLDSMLNNLMKDYISPLCKVFFPEVCEVGEFDSHHGFVIEYGDNRDAPDSGLDMDDSDITLNVRLNQKFEGGELCFRGTRCKKHARTAPKPEEIFDYCQTPGQAILHRGCLRNGARATSSGYRANMILWCRNSLFGKKITYQKECSDWCGQCAHEMKEKESQILAAKRKEMFRTESEAKEHTIGSQSVKP